MLRLPIFMIFYMIHSLQGYHIEDRSGIDWTYKPNIDHICNFIGCCGDPENPCSPEFWKFLNVDTFERCQHLQQSPINIEFNETYIEMNDPIIFNDIYCNGTINRKNNTWEIDFNENAKCSVKIKNTTWLLQNFHIHSGEHTIDGEYMPLEIHYVHKDDKENVMVISLLVSGTTRLFLHPMLQIFEHNNLSLNNISPYDLISQNKPSYWYYEGSLTTPPCQINNTSHVRWFIMKDFLEIHHQQIYFFTEYLKQIPKSYNGRVSRPIQELHQNTKIYSFSQT